MKVNLEIELVPFNVPDFVFIKRAPRPRQDGIQFDNNIPLSELDSATLHNLCEQFYGEVFRRAGKEPPPRAA